MIVRHFHLETLDQPVPLAHFWLRTSSCLLATRGHQAGLAHQQPRLSVPQARAIELGPDLLRAMAGPRPDLEPIRLGQGSRLTRLDPGSEAGQRNHRGSQKRKYRQGSERFDHFGLLTLAGRRSRRARGSADNNSNDRMFRRYNLYSNGAPTQSTLDLGKANS